MAEARLSERPGAGTRAIRRALWRLLGFAVVLALLAWRFGEPMAESLAGPFGREIEWLAPTFLVHQLSVGRDGADAVFRVQVRLARQVELGGQVAYPNPQGSATASTLIGHALVPAILLMATTFAWPAARGIDYAWRALVLPPVLVLLWVIDVPLILLAALWRLLFQALDPGGFSALWIWSVFLQGGGELALALAFGVSIGRWGTCARANRVRA